MSEDLAALMGRPITPGMRIGLLGGSFNPAHDGHLHISRQALKLLGLDQVWWLVSPQNPLKPSEDMTPFEERLKSAVAMVDNMADNPAICVSDLEAKLNTRYTADTLDRLIAAAPGVHFVWLMGADNLAQLPTWKNWEQIMATVPMAVMARPGFEGPENLGEATERFQSSRIPSEDAALLPGMAPPAWVFLPIPLHHASATQIRQAKKDPANKP